jgi:hypothetical protein
MTAPEAARSLAEHLNRPKWLSCIGVGRKDGKETLCVMCNFEPRPYPQCLREPWEGYELVVTVTGPMRLCGA